MIKALLISNMRDEELRLKLLQKERTLDAILNIARTKPDAVERGKILDRKSGNESGVNKVERVTRRRVHKQSDTKSSRCERCGYAEHKGEKAVCPAANRECIVCHKMDHFASVC